MQADSSAATLPALIEASSITVRRGEVPVLDHVDLTLSAGEIVCIIGPNGSGKTTLLRALLGLIAVQDGSVTRRPSLRIENGTLAIEAAPSQAVADMADPGAGFGDRLPKRFV